MPEITCLIMRYLSVLDLFSGPGGLAHGIRGARNHDVRFKIIVANDCDVAVQSTYTQNHQDVEFVPGSIADEDTKESITRAIRRTGRQHVDLVIGGPPCKGFSLENKMTRNMGNPMNHLVMHYAEMVRRTSPLAFIMENVPGILAMRSGGLVDDLIRVFVSLGYKNTAVWLLNAAEYGVPQLRKRAFIVGSKSDIPIPLPKKTHVDPSEMVEDSSLSGYVTLADAIGDLPRIGTGKTSPADNEYVGEPKCRFQEAMRRRSARVTNHVVTKNTPAVIRRIRAVPSGGNWRDIPADLLQVDGKYKTTDFTHSMIYKRLERNHPSITITNFRKAMIIHPNQHRLLSVREAARIQTFPDHFKFIGSIGQMQQQVSDAVPVMLARSVGEAMLRHMRTISKPIVVANR